MKDQRSLSHSKKARKTEPSEAPTVIVRGEKAYAGAALVKQEPEKRLTRAQQLEHAKDDVLKAFERFATLLSGEHVTLPLMQAAYFIIDKVWRKPIEDMRKLVNESLKIHMREHTVKLPEGGEKLAPLDELTLDYGGETYKATRTVQRHQMGKAPDLGDVKAMAVELGCEWTALCVAEVSYKFDKEKALAKIVEFGKAKTVDAAEKFIDDRRVQKSETLGVEKV